MSPVSRSKLNRCFSTSSRCREISNVLFCNCTSCDNSVRKPGAFFFHDAADLFSADELALGVGELVLEDVYERYFFGANGLRLPVEAFAIAVAERVWYGADDDVMAVDTCIFGCRLTMERVGNVVTAVTAAVEVAICGFCNVFTKSTFI